MLKTHFISASINADKPEFRINCSNHNQYWYFQELQLKDIMMSMSITNTSP